MCGLAGVWGVGPRDCPDPLPEMLGDLAHRGPDGEGFWRGDAVALGHRRLAILDPDRGHQPIGNEDGTVMAVHNGELYNLPQLRRELERKGHRFRTGSDAEVLPHLFEDEGPGFVTRLRGMFAFAVSDGRRLLLARDPLGIKPLYYGWGGGRLYFASEMKPLFRVAERVHLLPPGHVAYVERAALPGRPLATRPYHALPEAGRWEACPWNDAVAQVRSVLAEAVRDHLVADVPVGVLLSGGLDSTFVAALARKMQPGPLHTFSVGMRGSADLACARRAAAALGSEHHEYAYSAEEVREVLPRIVPALESFDPALVRSAVPTWFVSRLAGRHVKVVLTGEGADELFAGYDSLKGMTSQPLDIHLRTLVADLHWTNLQRVDRMTMAHGVEARVPYLDLRLVELAFRLPWSYKRPAAGPGKLVLRAAARGLVPDEVVDRPKAKFSQGTGTAGVLRRLGAEAAGGGAWRTVKRPDGSPFTSGEEWMYAKWFGEALPASATELFGRTRSVVAGEVEPAGGASGRTGG